MGRKKGRIIAEMKKINVHLSKEKRFGKTGAPQNAIDSLWSFWPC